MLLKFFTITVSLLAIFNVQASTLEELDQIQASLSEKGPAISEADPYEAYNRKIHNFNMEFIDKIGKPVADVYVKKVPDPVKTGLKNFVYNLKMPLNVLNAFLQGKGQKGFEGLMRFSMNSVFGLAGLLDVATPAGLPYEKKDFGQTLFIWGVWTESHYIVVPFLGPYTTRELFGAGVETFKDPTYQSVVKVDSNTQLATTLSYHFINFTDYVDMVETMKLQPDSYLFLRESYLQYRRNQLYDGHAPQPVLDNFDFE